MSDSKDDAVIGSVGSSDARSTMPGGMLEMPPEEAIRADARTESVAGDAMLLLRIAGMHCHRCEARVSETLQAIRGVKEAEIDFNSGSASVLYDPKQADPAAIVEAVGESGYDVTGFQNLGGS